MSSFAAAEVEPSIIPIIAAKEGPYEVMGRGRQRDYFLQKELFAVLMSASKYFANLFGDHEEASVAEEAKYEYMNKMNLNNPNALNIYNTRLGYLLLIFAYVFQLWFSC